MVTYTKNYDMALKSYYLKIVSPSPHGETVVVRVQAFCCYHSS